MFATQLIVAFALMVSAALAQTADPVNVTVYYESLCPDSKRFISEQLWPAYQSISEIFTVVFTPFGKENITEDGDTWEFSCQHGPEECYGNKIHIHWITGRASAELFSVSHRRIQGMGYGGSIPLFKKYTQNGAQGRALIKVATEIVGVPPPSIQSCALNYYPDNADSLPFICCSMSASDPVNASLDCAEQYNLDSDEIYNCTDSDLGSQLLHDNGVTTQSLDPPMTYVPWIILNDVYTETNEVLAQENFLRLICDTYQGTPPDGCL